MSLDFNMIQSLNSYTKNMEMQMNWQKKKASGDLTSKDDGNEVDWVRQQAEEIREAQNDGSAKLDKQIDLKLNSGQKLTAEEMEYLRKKDPQTYQKIKSIEAEQESYERELKRCKTKEEVQRVKMSHTAASLNAVNSIKNNPVIPEEKKFELIMHEHRKNAALEKTTQEFVKSGKFAKLPTEEERIEAEKDLKEAKEAELHIQDPADKAEEQESKETDSHEAFSTESTEKLTKDNASKSETPTSDNREPTRMEAETTPEALKVKRAKAQAAYKMIQLEDLTGSVLDVKAE